MKDVASCTSLVRSRTHHFEALYQFIIPVATCVQEISANPKSAFACPSIMFTTKPRPRNTEKRNTLTTPTFHTVAAIQKHNYGVFTAAKLSRDSRSLRRSVSCSFPGFSFSHGLTIRNSEQHGRETGVDGGLSGR